MTVNAALRVVRTHVEMQKSRDSLELETHKLWYYDMYIWSGCILDASCTVRPKQGWDSRQDVEVS